MRPSSVLFSSRRYCPRCALVRISPLAPLGQYLLLENNTEDGLIECLVRTGSPAYPKYKAAIVYLPPAWVKENKNNLSESDPLGTGENDFALLKISKSLGDI